MLGDGLWSGQTFSGRSGTPRLPRRSPGRCGSRDAWRSTPPPSTAPMALIATVASLPAPSRTDWSGPRGERGVGTAVRAFRLSRRALPSMSSASSSAADCSTPAGPLARRSSRRCSPSLRRARDRAGPPGRGRRIRSGDPGGWASADPAATKGSRATVVEICAEDALGVRRARDGGADRVEVCRDSGSCGASPRHSTRLRRPHCSRWRVQVLVRPRPGDFGIARRSRSDSTSPSSLSGAGERFPSASSWACLSRRSSTRRLVCVTRRGTLRHLPPGL